MSATGYTGGRGANGRPYREVSPCPGCGEDVLWLSTPNGKRMPVSLQPDPVHGDVVVLGANLELDHPHRWRLAVTVRDHDLRSEARDLGLELRTAHFGICQARQMRERADLA